MEDRGSASTSASHFLAVCSPAAFQLVADYHLNKTTGDLATDWCNNLNYVFMTWKRKKTGALKHIVSLHPHNHKNLATSGQTPIIYM